MITDVQNIIANEARKLELKLKLSSAKAKLACIQESQARIGIDTLSVSNEITRLTQELSDIEAGSGPGVTADFGKKSIVTTFLEAEREAAKSACIDFIKANPACTEAEAASAWDAGALAAHPEFPLVAQPGAVFGVLYRVNLLKNLQISSNTWEAQRDWILATPKETIMTS